MCVVCCVLITWFVHSVRGYSTVAGLPWLMFQHLIYTKHHVFKGGEISKRMAKYPVLLFSHGLGGSPDCYRAFIEDFVSQVRTACVACVPTLCADVCVAHHLVGFAACLFCC